MEWWDAFWQWLLVSWVAFWTWANESALGATIVGGLILAALLGVWSLIVASTRMRHQARVGVEAAPARPEVESAPSPRTLTRLFPWKASFADRMRSETTDETKSAPQGATWKPLDAASHQSDTENALELLERNNQEAEAREAASAKAEASVSRYLDAIMGRGDPLAAWHLEYAPSVRLGSDRAWVFRLTNRADDVEPRHVKVTSADNRLDFPDGSSWNKVRPLETKRFFGVPGRHGKGNGPVVVTVSWVEDGETFAEEVRAGFRIV